MTEPRNESPRGGREEGSHDFREFERAGWERVPEHYARAFVDLTSQVNDPVLDAAMVGRESRVLDVATGPGFLAAAAVRRGAIVSAVDFSATMVAEARRRHPEIDVQVGDAEALPFQPATFGAVVVSFGLLHLARPEVAVREAARALVSGGRFAFTVWAPPEEAVGFGMVLRAVAKHGIPDVPLPAGPGFFRFSDPLESERVLLDAGFSDPRISRVPQTWRLESPDAVFDTMLTSTVRTAALLRAQPPDARERIRAAVTEEAGRYRNGEFVELPMPAILAAARRP